MPSSLQPVMSTDLTVVKLTRLYFKTHVTPFSMTRQYPQQDDSNRRSLTCGLKNIGCIFGTDKGSVQYPTQVTGVFNLKSISYEIINLDVTGLQSVQRLCKQPS
jgi:hypothetical protein